MSRLNQNIGQGSDRIRTDDVRIKISSANHYTTEP